MFYLTALQVPGVHKMYQGMSHLNNANIYIHVYLMDATHSLFLGKCACYTVDPQLFMGTCSHVPPLCAPMENPMNVPFRVI